ncbi:rhodanese-like domain-containing protein [Sulfurirhabdus autotrophica]|uniref:Rhodanese-related sulfurtransferase n=1 Tax=Sulfurirhabdus autotrophica TaxID=1706046 RepID=A0A4R3YEM8_9PROT|nr:rhodanese-like domain-containing protein [Sulfurirhabdus autotrophica]TCV90342.1 rhodanese-related sulfurtransferase [Sulfurirhabdus autotrophica]
MLTRLLGILLLTFSLGACSEPPYTSIDNAQLKTLIAQGIPLYDIRRPEEWMQTNVVEGSHKLTYVDASGRMNPAFLGRFTAEVNKNDPVILICRTGSRTRSLAHELTDMGYTKIYNVRNGITNWISEGNPVVKN